MIQIISPKVLQESTTILQLKVYIVSVMKNKLGTHLSRSVLLIWLHSFSHLPGMQDLWTISFFFFSMKFHIIKWEKWRIPIFANKFRGLGLEGLKVPKIKFLGFWQKSYSFRYTFLLQHEVPMFFFVLFAKTTCLQKSGSWVMIQKPQNAGFFKPQYLTKNLRYEVEFLDMIRGARKH